MVSKICGRPNRIATTLAIIGVLSACATYVAEPRPANWPAPIASTCADLSGDFLDHGTDNLGHAASLYTLLRRGDGYTDSESSNVTRIRIDATRRQVERQLGTNWYPESEPISPIWSCGTDGVWRATFERHIQSEGSVADRSLFSLTLHIAAANTLIVHLDVRFAGGIFSGGGRERWMRFERITKLR